MASYVASVDSPWDREAAFEYLADFSTISEWDPNVPSARCLSDDPRAVGARFEVDFEFLGPAQKLPYETIEIEAPRFVTFRSETATAVSVDRMTFDLKPGGGTIVTYDANVTLKSALRLFELPFRLVFRRFGDGARDGLQRKLTEVQPGGARSETP